MDIEKAFEEFAEDLEKEARTYIDRKYEKKKKGITPQSQKKKRWGSGGYGKGEEVEESEEDEAYGGTKKWKKGQKKMKKAGIELHKKDRFSGYVEDAEIEEGYKDLPPHLQKLIKKIEKKQKDWNKQNPNAKIKTLVYNPETGKPDIEVKENTMKLENTVQQVLEGKKKKGEDPLTSKEPMKAYEDSDPDAPGKQGDEKEYQKKRDEILKGYGVKACGLLKDEKEKAQCFKDLDDAHVADHEEQAELKKIKKEENTSKLYSAIKTIMQKK